MPVSGENGKMNIVATIQARMASTRLPGKVLREVAGKPLLLYQVERLSQSKLIDDLIIATSRSPSDDRLEDFAKKNGLKVFRGSENDVLQRIVDALSCYGVDVHVEFMGDNPIPDPNLVDSIIGFYLKHKDKYDYVTNALKTTFPPGFEVSVYPSRVLYAAAEEADAGLREHVGLHIYSRPDRFRIYNIEADTSISRAADYHFEVDTLEDFEVLSAVIEHFMPRNPYFSMGEAIEFLRQHPDLSKKNAGVERRWRTFRKE